MAITNQRFSGVTDYQVSQLEFKQAVEVFEEIATSAASIDRLCFNMAYADRENVDALHCTIEVMRTLVARIGWLGDMGCKKLTGGESINGDAEHWMMSPVYVAAMDTEAANTTGRA